MNDHPVKHRIGSTILSVLLAFCLHGVITGCLSGEEDSLSTGAGDGLWPVQDLNGTKIKFDPLASPMPEIPFPIDLATVLDSSSGTGRRLNIRMHAPTLLEQGVRNNVNGLDGFGTFSPITVAFEKPLDLRTLSAKNIRVINIDPSSPRYGQEIPIDFPPHDLPGSTGDHPDWTAYPLIIEGTENSFQHPGEGLIDFGYFHFDPHWPVNNLMLEGNEEDGNCNGVLDAGEDRDFDGVLDHPNIAYSACYNRACFAKVSDGGWVSPFPQVCPDPDVAPFNQWDQTAPKNVLDNKLVTNFEYQTNTAILRPLVALEQRTRYAVVLSRNLRDIEGNPVRSPFSYVNHAVQTRDLQPLKDILPSLPENPLQLNDVAFTWCFTTQTITRGLEVIRDGMKGRGPMGYLATRFPARVERVMDHQVCGLGDCDEKGIIHNTVIVRPEAMKELFAVVIGVMTSSWIHMSDLVPIIRGFLDANLSYVDYFVVGWFQSPNFLAGPDSIFDIDYDTGRARVEMEEIPFWLTVPKSRKDLPGPVPSWYPDPPFPVAFYGHGYSGAKFETAGFAGNLARFGLATFAIDETGHGPSGELGDLANVLDEIFEIAGKERGLDDILRLLGPLKVPILNGLGDLIVRYFPDGQYDSGQDLVRECEKWQNEDPEATTCKKKGSCPAKCMIVKFSETPLFQSAFLSGRAKYTNSRGVLVSGVDFWTARSFHTRDIVRQAVVDYIQAIRVLQSFDGKNEWDFDVNGDGVREKAGDFNADGIPDVGGLCSPDYSQCRPGEGSCLPILDSCSNPDDPEDKNRQNYSAMGQSLGAFVVSLVQVVEPAMSVAAPVSGGAGLMDIGMRTKNEGVREAVYLEVMGPMIIGGMKKHVARRWSYYDVWFDDEGFGEVEDGQWVLAFDALDGNLEKIWPISEMPELKPGDRILVTNFANGEARNGGVISLGYDDGEILGFRVNIPADVGDRLLVQVFDGATGDPIWETQTTSISSGYGYKRNSPDLRRMMGLSQMILDPADPANWARHYFMDLRPGMKPKSILINHTLGDLNVPLGAGLTMARAAGILDWKNQVAAFGGDTESEMMIHNYVGEAVPRIPRFGAWGEGSEGGLGPYFDPDNLAANDENNGRPDYDDDCSRGTYPAKKCLPLNEPHLSDNAKYKAAGVGESYATRHFRKTFSTPGTADRNGGEAEKSGLRIPNSWFLDMALNAEDRHGVFMPAPTKNFNSDQYMINLIGRYMQTRGRDLPGDQESDNASCLEDKKDPDGNPVNPCEFWEGMP